MVEAVPPIPERDQSEVAANARRRARFRRSIAGTLGALGLLIGAFVLDCVSGNEVSSSLFYVIGILGRCVVRGAEDGGRHRMPQRGGVGALGAHRRARVLQAERVLLESGSRVVYLPDRCRDLASHSQRPRA